MTRTSPLALLCFTLACAGGDSRAKPVSSASSVGTAVAAAAEPASTTKPGPDSLLIDAADRGRVTGAEAARVWLLVVSDFQCPFCKQWHDSTYQALKREYVDSGKLRMAFLNMPLSMHRNARPAAIAAMCASAQGKFWTTQDRIFETQKTWEVLPDPAAYLDSLAVASGSDPAGQHTCSSGRLVQPLIERDLVKMRQAGVQSTPTFFVGSAVIEGAQPVKLFRHVIDSVLTASKRGK